MVRFNLFILFLAIFISCNKNTQVTELPIYGEKTLVTKAFDSYKEGDTVYHHIPDFYLLNQDSVLVQKSDFKNKILLVDFFFVTCPTICPVMTKNMNSIVHEFSDSSNIEFLSFTVNPEFDTPSVINSYILSKKLDVSKWNFLTGNKDHIYDVAYHGFLANAMEDDNAPGGFLHSSLFFLIDTDGKIRGIYDGVIEDEIIKCKKDILKLYKNEF